MDDDLNGLDLDGALEDQSGNEEDLGMSSRFGTEEETDFGNMNGSAGGAAG
ncbi:hypothetical protein [Deinococcus alpinitundrae]|uniref:hypothetical protein n=1 Tax=Deinococcus alpinitundrae TaxID=468913 RepID=UPI00137B4D68|nr:hypothetical protein [Deinococcus alpinitundrae]